MECGVHGGGVGIDEDTDGGSVDRKREEEICTSRRRGGVELLHVCPLVQRFPPLSFLFFSLSLYFSLFLSSSLLYPPLVFSTRFLSKPLTPSHQYYTNKIKQWWFSEGVAVSKLFTV